LLSGKKIYNGLYSLPLDILISPIAFGYYVAGRFFLSKTFIANYNCTNCGLCIRECPTSSIKLVSNRPYWKLSCESCMRCLNNCPEKAIEAAHGMAVGFWLLITIVNARIILLLIKIFGIQPETTWFKIFTNGLSLVCTVFIPAVVYIVVHYAMGLKPVKYILRFTSFTALPFWRRYPPRTTRKTL
jgi:Pyruvate/2-oxoacid:ferredoxin oxidoreductase delta subunit